MVSFDIKSLFTNVPSEKTIDIALERTYDHKEINTQITRPEMKELLTLCTKDVHFIFDNQVYQQNVGVATESTLRPVLAGIFMVELENRIIPILGNMVLNWKRFVDDTIVYIKNASIHIVLSKINSFHPNIEFTYEIEKANKVPFLDVLLIRNGNFTETKVYRKQTNNNIYLNWNSFAPNTWKRSTLRTLIKRAYLNCSSE